MPHIFDSKKLSKLESSDRYDEIKPEKLLKEIGLKAGDTVLDVGVGTGFFAVPALEIIGELGKLFGTDISKDMLEYTRERTKTFSNVELILNDGINIPVEENSVDFAIMSFVLHETSDKDKVISQVRKTLKSGGTFCIVEWGTENLEKGPPEKDRISVGKVAILLDKEGFLIKSHKTISNRFYCIISEKEWPMKIGFVTIHVSNMKRTVEFYEKVMGFSVIRQFQAGPQVEIIFVDDGYGNRLEFISGTGKTVETKGLSIGFKVEDIEKTHEHLKNNGVKILFGPHTMPSGVKLLNALDINGVELGFVQED